MERFEHVKQYTVKFGCDVGYHTSNLHPSSGEGRVGVSGIDKNYSLSKIIQLAYKMEEKPNILIKGGPNSKWYIKKFDTSVIEEEIQKQKKWRDTRRSTMYIIEWDD
jgi:hypothetical protein